MDKQQRSGGIMTTPRNERPNDPEGYAKDYGHVLMDRAFYHSDVKDMVHGDRLLLAAMGHGMRRGCPAVRMSESYAQELLGDKSENTTRARFKRLRKLGWLRCIPGKGTRPTEWVLELPPSELEVALRRGLEAYNAKATASPPVHRGTRKASPSMSKGTTKASPSTHRGAKGKNTRSPSVHGGTTDKTSNGASPSVHGGTREASPSIDIPYSPNGLGGTNRTNKTDKTDSPSEPSSKTSPSVVPISSNVAIQKPREELFGPGMMISAQRLATFLEGNVNDALNLMEAKAGAVSPGVVLNAISNLDVSGLDHKGQTIKKRDAWFDRSIEFAKVDAAGAWLDAPKVAKDDTPSKTHEQLVAEEEARSEKFRKLREDFSMGEGA